MTALVLRHIPERVPRTKSELADIYLTESNKIETDRMKSRDRKRDDDEVVKSRYDSLIADKEAQLTELQNEIEKLRHEMFGQLYMPVWKRSAETRNLPTDERCLICGLKQCGTELKKTMTENDRKRTENDRKRTENDRKRTKTE